MRGVWDEMIVFTTSKWEFLSYGKSSAEIHVG